MDVTKIVRNANFAEMRAGLGERAAAVLEDFRKHGPVTTMTLALVTGRSVLSVRPRATELLALGALYVVGTLREGRVRHSVLGARSEEEWPLAYGFVQTLYRERNPVQRGLL
jgi:hypothetical protein